MYRVNFSGSSVIKIYSIRQLQRVLRDTKRNKYGSAVKCGTAGKPKCGKVRYCGVKGYAVKCGTAGQGVKQYLFMINIQVYNYYNTWLKGIDNKIENLILSHLLITITLFTIFDVDKMT